MATNSPSELDKQIEIKNCREQDVELLEKLLPSPGQSRFHERRFLSQKNEHCQYQYLVAWLGDEPVGHLHLLWNGSEGEEVKRLLPQCPELNALAIRPEYQSHGIGTRLIETAENLARQRGFSQVGLGVRPDNLGARRLYERLGYRDWGHGLHTGSWMELDDEGKPYRVEEDALYLVKQLSAANL